MFAPVAGVTVKVIGTPALALGGFAVKLARLRALTLTVAAVDVTVPAVAATLAVGVVVNVAVAIPLLSVVADGGEIDALSVANVTGTPPIGLPPSSVTDATTCTV